MSEDCFDDFDYDRDDDNMDCEGCVKRENDPGFGRCPLCCNNGGSYAPGSEECDFCPSSDECARFAARQYDRRPRKRRITAKGTPFVPGDMQS